MARKKKQEGDGYNKTLSRRLRETIEKQGVTQDEIAAWLGITRQAVSTYTLGDSVPDAEKLETIARGLNVSADYLLGLSDSPSLEYDYQNAFKFTGLKQEAIANLNKMMNIEEQQIEVLGIDKEEYYKGKIAPVVYDIVSAIIANKHFVDLVTYVGQASIYPEEQSKAIPHITDDGNYYYGGIFGREFIEYKAMREFKSLMEEVISENKYKGAE